MSATKLSLAQLIDCARIAPARGGCGCHGGGMNPKCYWHNEIGLVFEAGGDCSAQAEEHLRGLLTIDDEDQRYVAYGYLKSSPDQIGPATLAALDQFEADPKNADLKLLWGWQHTAHVFDRWGEGAAAAEAKLCQMLTHPDQRARQIAGHTLLAKRDVLTPTSQAAVRTFQDDPTNADMIERILQDIEFEKRDALMDRDEPEPDSDSDSDLPN